VNTSSAASSIYAKPVVPRIVVRPALASVLLHGLLLFVLTANWADSTRNVIVVKPQPKVINARLVDASELKPKPQPKPVAPAPKPKPKPKPKAAPVAKPKPAPKPKPKPVVAAKPKPAPAAKPEPVPAPAKAEPEQPRMTQQELAALTRADLARAVAEEQSAAQAAATSAEMAASYAALIQQTVVNYWSRPPSARNGMETLLSIQLIPTGEVVSVTIVKSSGNTAFDRSAVNAVEKAGSFPELQNLPSREFEKTFRRFSLLFRPEDLRY
jgi:colicin import membrane protein